MRRAGAGLAGCLAPAAAHSGGAARCRPRDYQPPASRMMRRRIRPATARRYSAVERTSSIGVISASSVAAAAAATAAVGVGSLERHLGGSGADRRRRDGAEGDANVAPRAVLDAPGDRDHDHADRLCPPRADLAKRDGAVGAKGDPDPEHAARPAAGRSAGRPGRRPPRGWCVRPARSRRRSPRRGRGAPAGCRRPARRSRCCRRACRGSGSARPRPPRPWPRGQAHARRRAGCGAAPRTSRPRRRRGRPPRAGSRAARRGRRGRGIRAHRRCRPTVRRARRCRRRSGASRPRSAGRMPPRASGA